MIFVPVGLFALAAPIGLYMAIRVFRGTLAPWPVALVHSLLAASGLAALIYALLTTSQPLAVLAATGLLVAAALGGSVLASFHLRGMIAPKVLVALHAVTAVAGLLVLAAAVLWVV